MNGLGLYWLSYVWLNWLNWLNWAVAGGELGGSISKTTLSAGEPLSDEASSIPFCFLFMANSVLRSWISSFSAASGIMLQMARAKRARYMALLF